MLVDGVRFHSPQDTEAQGDSRGDVIVLSGTNTFLLARQGYEQLVPLLTGEFTLNEIASKLRGKMSPVEVFAQVQLLARNNAVVDAQPTDSAAANGSTMPPRIRILALGDLDVTPIVGALADLDMEILTAAVIDDEAVSAPVDLTVIVTDHYLREELESFNRDASQPWLLLRPTAHEMWLGPLVVPGKTACWKCLASRLHHNGKMEQFIAHKTGALPVVTTNFTRPTPATMQLAAGVIAAQVETMQDIGTDGSLCDRLVSLTPADMTSEVHIATRRPQCPVCGDPHAQEPQPITLKSCKIPPAGADSFEDAARDTLAQYDHHISPITGLVRGLVKRSSAPGIHVYQGGDFSAQTPKSWEGLMADIRVTAGAKGTTDLQAQAAALAETLEWFSLSATSYSSAIEASYADLSKREHTIHPASLAHFSAAQYAARETINARVDSRYRIPRPFDENAEIGWRKIWSMTGDEWINVPLTSCSLASSPYINSDSNGAAAGRTREDAILHGFFELVERDAVAIWWYNRLNRPRVDLSGIDPQMIESMQAFYAGFDHQFHLLDITSDFGIPVLVAVATHNGAASVTQPPVYGFGCHFDPRTAAIRALTELNQYLPNAAQFANRYERPGYACSIDLSERDLAHTKPDPAAGAIDLGSLPLWHSGDLRDDILECVERTRSLGLDFLVSDLTQPDIDLPVVKVIVPGLRHCYPQLGSGRLFDVPVKLGWLDSPSPEEGMADLGSPL